MLLSITYHTKNQMQEITAIGITQKTGLICGATDLTTSQSGLFLDQLPGLGADWFASDGNYGTCDQSRSYLRRLVNARAEALDLTKEAIYKAVTGANKPRIHNFTGYLGQRQGIGAANSDAFIIKSGIFNDAHLHLSKIGVVASGIGTATVTLTYPDAMAQVFIVEVGSSGYNGIDTNIKLPLDGTHYTFTVATTDGLTLLNNEVGCGCGQKDTAMLSYMKFGGAYAAGISLTATVKCDVNDFLGRAYDESTDVQKISARMLYYRAGVVLCDYILGDVTPQETDTDLEYIKQKRGNLLQEFEDRLDYLVESGLNAQSSTCFACTGPRMVTIG